MKLGGASDIERAQRFEAELKVSQRLHAETIALLDTLQAHAPVGFAFVDRDFRMMRVNDTLAAFNGSTVAEHLSQPVAVMVPHMWPQLEPLYRRVLDTGHAVRDVAVQGPSAADAGRIHHWLFSFYPVFVADEVVGIGIVVVDDTERTDAEDARRLLACIVQDSGDAIFSSTPDGVVTSWNAAAERLFGYTAQEIIGHPVAVIAPTGRLGEQQQMLARMNAGGSTERLETTRRRKDGNLVDVVITASPSRDRDGTIVGMSVIMHDITENRAAQREAHTRQRRLDEAQHIAGIGSFELDLVTGELNWSAEHYRILGLDPALAASAELFLPLVDHEDRPALTAAWQQAIEGGVGFDLLCRVVRPDAELRWVHIRAVPDVAAHGTVSRLVGTLQDETESVEAARSRREVETLFETSFAQAGIGGMIVGLDGVPIRVNAAVCGLLGRPQEELLGREWIEYTHPDDVHLRPALAAADDTYADERRFVRPDASIVWASVHVTLVRDIVGKPQYYLAQLQDITERKRVQDDLAHQALHDSLTGLANVTLLADRLTYALASRRFAQIGVIFLDIDQFKVVNDSYGRAAGDVLLTCVAERLRATIRVGDTAARYGGDEFVVICDEASPGETKQIAERLLAAIRMPYRLDDRDITITASLGIAIADASSTTQGSSATPMTPGIWPRAWAATASNCSTTPSEPRSSSD